jgi:hypothetical protein
LVTLTLGVLLVACCLLPITGRARPGQVSPGACGATFGISKRFRFVLARLSRAAKVLKKICSRRPRSSADRSPKFRAHLADCKRGQKRIRRWRAG